MNGFPLRLEIRQWGIDSIATTDLDLTANKSKSAFSSVRPDGSVAVLDHEVNAGLVASIAE